MGLYLGQRLLRSKSLYTDAQTHTHTHTHTHTGSTALHEPLNGHAGLVTAASDFAAATDRRRCKQRHSFDVFSTYFD